MQHVGGGKAGISGRVRQPAASQQSLPFHTQTHLHERTEQMESPDSCVRRRTDDRRAGNMACRERYTVLGTHGQYLGVFTQYMGFSMEVRPRNADIFHCHGSMCREAGASGHAPGSVSLNTEI